MATWVQSDAPNTGWINIASDSTGTILFAVDSTTTGGIWKSINSGQNWTITTAPLLTNAWRGIASSSDGTKLVAVSGLNDGKIYTSIDSGASWSPQSGAPAVNWMSVASSSDGTKLVACVNDFNLGGGIYISNDSGSTWNQATTPLKGWSKVASNSDGTRLVAGVDGNYTYPTYVGGVYVSSNSGGTWTLTSLPTNDIYVWQCLASDSTGRKLVAGSGVGGIYTSYNYGVNWTLTSAPTTGWKSVASDSRGTNLVAVETSKIYISANSGVFWTQTNSSGNWQSVASNSLGTKLVAVVSGGGIYTYNNPSAVCFLEGSKILTDKGYVLIQDLRKGDLIQTWKHGYKPIDMIGKKEFYNPACNERIKDQLYKYSSNQYPEMFEDLIITGSHSILVDNFKDPEQREQTRDVLGDIYGTDYKYRLPACVDEKSTIYEKKGNFMIYHIALENEHYYANYGVYANGLLVETCSKRYLKELADMALIE